MEEAADGVPYCFGDRQEAYFKQSLVVETFYMPTSLLDSDRIDENQDPTLILLS